MYKQTLRNYVLSARAAQFKEETKEKKVRKKERKKMQYKGGRMGVIRKGIDQNARETGGI